MRGKSTTLPHDRRAGGGLRRRKSIINDRLVNHVRPRGPGHRHGVPNYALYPHMTVCKTWPFGLNCGIRVEESISASARPAEVLNLGALMDRTPKSLSGSQRQRGGWGEPSCEAPSLSL